MACFLTGNKTTGYGIRLIEYCNEAVKSSCLVEHLSRNRSETLALIELCAREEVSPVHLPEVVADMLSEKNPPVPLCGAVFSLTHFYNPKDKRKRAVVSFYDP